MNTASFNFSGKLNDLLVRDCRNREIEITFASHQSVKHLIEALGVPHVEVGLITANDEKVQWTYRPQNGDRIEAQPAEGCPTEPRFILDIHLGRLAAYLRMLGFDSLYEDTYADDEMAKILEKDPRILLTRDRQLLMRKAVRYGYCLRSLEPQDQLQEILCRFDLKPVMQPFHRCLRCNGELFPVEKSTVLAQLEPKTKLFFDEFVRCTNCGQVYWKGSHFERMEKLITSVF